MNEWRPVHGGTPHPGSTLGGVVALVRDVMADQHEVTFVHHEHLGHRTWDGGARMELTLHLVPTDAERRRGVASFSPVQLVGVYAAPENTTRDNTNTCHKDHTRDQCDHDRGLPLPDVPQPHGCTAIRHPRATLRRILSTPAPPGTHRVLMGDFNAGVGTPRRRWLETTMATTGTWVIVNGVGTEQDPLLPTRSEPGSTSRQLDLVLAHGIHDPHGGEPPQPPPHVRRCEVLHPPGPRWGMDHLPILTDLFLDPLLTRPPPTRPPAPRRLNRYTPTAKQWRRLRQPTQMADKGTRAMFQRMVRHLWHPLRPLLDTLVGPRGDDPRPGLLDGVVQTMWTHVYTACKDTGLCRLPGLPEVVARRREVRRVTTEAKQWTAALRLHRERRETEESQGPEAARRWYQEEQALYQRQRQARGQEQYHRRQLAKARDRMEAQRHPPCTIDYRTAHTAPRAVYKQLERAKRRTAPVQRAPRDVQDGSAAGDPAEWAAHVRARFGPAAAPGHDRPGAEQWRPSTHYPAVPPVQPPAHLEDPPPLPPATPPHGPAPDADPFDHCLVAPRNTQWDVTLDQVQKAVRGLRPASSTRDAPPWLLRALVHAESVCVDADEADSQQSAPVLLQLLHALIQRASRGDIHGEQSLEDMRLHHKKGDGTAMSHYRPLVVGTLFRRVLDRTVAEEVNRLLQPHDSVAQTGFTPGRSHHDMVYITHTFASAAATPHPIPPLASYKALTTIAQRLAYPRTHDPCAVATLDISNAYPSVDMETLWHILTDRGLDTPATRLMLMCMRGTRVSVKFGRDPHGTAPQRVYRGTSQGSPYSPIAWRAYLLGLPTRMPGVQALIYADDVALLSTGPRALSHMHLAMHTIAPVLTRRGLALSGAKTKVAEAGRGPGGVWTVPVPPVDNTIALNHTSPDPAPLTLLGHQLVLGDQSHHVALRRRTAQKRLYATARDVQGMALSSLPADATTAANIAQVFFLPVFDQGVSTPELHKDHYDQLMRVWEQAVREAAWVTPVGKGQFSHATQLGMQAALGLVPGHYTQRLHKIRQLARALRYPWGSPMRDALCLEWHLSLRDRDIRNRRPTWTTRPTGMNGDTWLYTKWTYAGIRWGASQDVLGSLDLMRPAPSAEWRQRVTAAWGRMATHVRRRDGDPDLAREDMQYMEYSYALWVQHKRNQGLASLHCLIEVAPLLSLMGLGAPIPAADGPRGLATSLRLVVSAGGARALVGYSEYKNIPRDAPTTCHLCHGAVYKRRWLEHLAVNCLHPRLVHERVKAARAVAGMVTTAGRGLPWCQPEGDTPDDVVAESQQWFQYWIRDANHITPSPWTADAPCPLAPAAPQEPPPDSAAPLRRWPVVWMALVWGLPVPDGVIRGYNPGGCRAEAARPHATRSSRGSPTRRRATMLATAGLVVAAAEEMAAAYNNGYVDILKDFVAKWQRRQRRLATGAPR